VEGRSPDCLRLTGGRRIRAQQGSRRLTTCAPAVLAALAALALAPHAAAGVHNGCATPAPPTSTLRSALASGRDVLGERLLRSSAGPTYRGVRRLLPSLWYARGRGGTTLTRSGAYYVTFGYPGSLYGEKAFGLHVADGSQVLVRRSTGPALSVVVGRRPELFGSCLPRLGGPHLAEGWLPILQTTYVDADGVHYAQESFVGRMPGVASAVSLVRLSVDARQSERPAIVRFVAARGERSRLLPGPGGVLVGDELRYRVAGTAVIHVGWLHRQTAGATVDEGTYLAARASVRGLWQEELTEATSLELPERRVVDAYRNALVQQRTLTWRYSAGNPYEELSFAEALDSATVVGRLGREDVAEAILRFAARRLPVRFSSWRAGALLTAAAAHVQLGGELPQHVQGTLVYALRRLESQILRGDRSGLLEREAFSSDVRRRVIGLHGQAVVWQGLRWMSRAWARLERPRLAARAARAATRLEHGLRAAIAGSERRLPDGSVFVPAALLDGGRPFDRLTASRDGSYWNLVAPYALASGLMRPHGRRAKGVWRYIQRHGGRLLGLVRADARRLYRGQVRDDTGIDQVYGLEVARFLADADLPEQLDLSLYGTLAGALTPGTFVGGEASTVVPLDGARRGALYLPPNGGTNTTFLETLRLTLVHERRNGRGVPVGLDLAFATPRSWLRPGATIDVRDAPTSFGPVSYSIARRGEEVRVTVDRPAVADVRLRVRTPTSRRIGSVELAGHSLPFEPASGTVRLPSGSGPVELVVRLRR
jgi:hypothetical protein